MGSELGLCKAAPSSAGSTSSGKPQTVLTLRMNPGQFKLLVLLHLCYKENSDSLTISTMISHFIWPFSLLTAKSTCELTSTS